MPSGESGLKSSLGYEQGGCGPADVNSDPF